MNSHKITGLNNCTFLNNTHSHVVSCRDHFYQFGELRSITIVSKQQCAFVQFTARSAAEQAAEKSFNKLIIGGRRLNIKWGKSQGQQQIKKDEEEEDGAAANMEPVPGLPGGMCCRVMDMIERGEGQYGKWETSKPTASLQPVLG